MKPSPQTESKRVDDAVGRFVARNVTDRGGCERQRYFSPRAYERFLERGAEHAHDLDDWLEAERELRQSPTSPVA